MKQTLRRLALASLALGAAPLVQAQGSSVTLYGIVDTGLEYASVNDAGGNVRIESGMASTSRFGLRGSEDLGGGLKGIFTLENGFRSDTGALGTAGAIFDRQAFVGLEGGFGVVKLGRQYTPGYWVLLRNSAFGYSLNGTVSNWARNSTTRISNSIVYETPRFGGLKGTLIYGSGDERFEPPQASGRFVGGSVEYAAGPLSLGLSHQELKPSVTGTATTIGPASKETALGGKYDFGPFALAVAAYRRAPSTGDAFKALSVGATAKLGPGEIWGMVTRLDAPNGSEGDATLVNFAYLYNLSRRTTLYTSLGLMLNNEDATFGMQGSGNSAAGPVDAGYNARSLMFGIRHTF